MHSGGSRESSSNGNYRKIVSWHGIVFTLRTKLPVRKLEKFIARKLAGFRSKIFQFLSKYTSTAEGPYQNLND